MSAPTHTAIEALAREILAFPDHAGLFADPAAVIVQMSARIAELRRQLDGVTHDCRVAEHWAGHFRAQYNNLHADQERLKDAAMWWSAKALGLPALAAAQG